MIDAGRGLVGLWDERQVELPVQQPLQVLVLRPGGKAEAHRDAGVQVVETGQDRNQVEFAGGQHRREGHGAAQPPGECVEVVPDGAGLREQGPCPVQDQAAGVGELDTSGAPTQQALAELTFQPLDGRGRG